MPLRLLGLCRFFFAWIAKTRLFTSVLALISPTNWIPVRASRSATPFPDASSHAGRQARTARTSARSGRSFVLFSLLLLLLARWLSPLAALAHRYIAAPTLAPTRFDQAPSACLSRLASFSLVASRANNLAEISFYSLGFDSIITSSLAPRTPFGRCLSMAVAEYVRPSAYVFPHMYSYVGTRVSTVPSPVKETSRCRRVPRDERVVVVAVAVASSPPTATRRGRFARRFLVSLHRIRECDD